MKKLLLLVAWVFCINCGIVMASSPDIAVAVVHGQFAAELSCEDELMVRVPDTGEEMVLKPDRYFVNAEGGTVNLGAQKFGAKTLRFVVKENGKPIEVNKKAYRGSFEVRISADGKTLDVVNVLPLEQYLYSVVGEEIPVIFPDEAIKAQAVAARSLAYNRLGNRSRLGYDLKASEEGQDYYGLTTEKQAINKLVDVTAGMVVTYNGQPIEAVYHQSGGGQTENSRDVWGRYVPYLRSVKDYDWDAPMYNWEKLCLQVRSNDVYRRVDMLSANLKAYVYHRWKAVAKCLEMIALPADGCRKCYSAAAAGHFFLQDSRCRKY